VFARTHVSPILNGLTLAFEPQSAVNPNLALIERDSGCEQTPFNAKLALQAALLINLTYQVNIRLYATIISIDRVSVFSHIYEGLSNDTKD
jgi:hypothetical protein